MRVDRFIKWTVIFSFFFVLSVSCWNIQFGAISNFRPTNSASSGENLRNRVHLFRQLWIFETIFSPWSSQFRKRSPSIPVISLSASLCSARKLIKYSKPNAVRVRRNAFMRDFPDFLEIYPHAVCSIFAVFIRGFPDFPKSRLLLCWIQWGRERRIEAIRYRRRLKIFENSLCFFFVLSVSCWNIRFGAICHFWPTYSSSSMENLRIVFTYFAKFKSCDSLPSSLENFWKFLVKRRRACASTAS